MAKSQTDVIETMEQAVAAEVVHRERCGKTVQIGNARALDVDGEMIGVVGMRALHQQLNFVLRKNDGRDAVLMAVLAEDVSE